MKKNDLAEGSVLSFDLHWHIYSYIESGTYLMGGRYEREKL